MSELLSRTQKDGFAEKLSLLPCSISARLTPAFLIALCLSGVLIYCQLVGRLRTTLWFAEGADGVDCG